MEEEQNETKKEHEVGLLQRGNCSIGWLHEAEHNRKYGRTSWQVVTTFYPMYDLLKQVAQDDAEVSMLLVPNGGALKLSEPDDRRNPRCRWKHLQQSQMETWVPDAGVHRYFGYGGHLCERRNHAAGIEGEAHAHDHESEEKGANAGHSHTVDPHVWLDPVLAQTGAGFTNIGGMD